MGLGPFWAPWKMLAPGGDAGPGGASSSLGEHPSVHSRATLGHVWLCCPLSVPEGREAAVVSTRSLAGAGTALWVPEVSHMAALWAASVCVVGFGLVLPE